jgi:hypothetical protein
MRMSWVLFHRVLLRTFSLITKSLVKQKAVPQAQHSLVSTQLLTWLLTLMWPLL